MQLQAVRAKLAAFQKQAILAAREAALALWVPAVLFALNIGLIWRLLRSEYIDQLASNEGVFMTLARYIQNHGAGYNWFPLWWAGMPFQHAYQPGLPGTVSVVSTFTGLTVPAAYHATVAASYALGVAMFYFLALTLTGSRRVAFTTGLAFTFFSPSTLLAPAIWRDAGGPFGLRRYQELVTYGDGPNITGQMLVLLALALLYRAMTRRTAVSGMLAALAMAAVPAVSWSSTLLLAAAAAAYVVAAEWNEVKAGALRLLLIVAGAAAFAMPFALPSTVRAAIHDANRYAADQATAGGAKIVCFALLGAGLIGLRLLTAQLEWTFARRFATLLAFVTGWIALTAYWAGVRMLPGAERYDTAMEMALFLAAAVFVPDMALWKSRPDLARRALVALLVACGAQALHGRLYADGMARPVKMNATIEYETARFFDLGLNQGRVFVPGTQSLWMNLFTETPQVMGCCDQSLTDGGYFNERYLIAAGYRGETEAADDSLMWLKAYAVRAVALGGPKSRGHSEKMPFPYRFRGKLEEIFKQGDDFIYLVPERAPSLARVVKVEDLVKHLPASGVDLKELRPFVAALDDEALPVAQFRWTSVNSAVATAVMENGQAVSVAVNYDPGWRAEVGGRPVPVQADGLGFIALEPQCEGVCEITLNWSPGREPQIAIGLAVLALIGGLAFVWRDWSEANFGLKPGW